MCGGGGDYEHSGVSLVEISKLFAMMENFMGQFHPIKYRSICQVPGSPYLTFFLLLKHMFLLILKSTVIHCYTPFIITDEEVPFVLFDIKCFYLFSHI